LREIHYLEFPTVVGPVEERLALTGPTGEVTSATVVGDLSNVSTDGLPSLNLAFILLRETPTQIVATVPLEPPPWVIGIYPALIPPHRE
jgi:hypothetical protein